MRPTRNYKPCTAQIRKVQRINARWRRVWTINSTVYRTYHKLAYFFNVWVWGGVNLYWSVHEVWFVFAIVKIVVVWSPLSVNVFQHPALFIFHCRSRTEKICFASTMSDVDTITKVVAFVSAMISLVIFVPVSVYGILRYSKHRKHIIMRKRYSTLTLFVCILLLVAIIIRILFALTYSFIGSETLFLMLVNCYLSLKLSKS